MKERPCALDPDFLLGVGADDAGARRHLDECPSCRTAVREIGGVVAILEGDGGAIFSEDEEGREPDQEDGTVPPRLLLTAAGVLLVVMSGLILPRLTPIESGSRGFRGPRVHDGLVATAAWRGDRVEVRVEEVTDADRYEAYLTTGIGESLLVATSQGPTLVLDPAEVDQKQGTSPLLWHVEAWRGLERLGRSSSRPLPRRQR